jgi:hypothetical protein
MLTKESAFENELIMNCTVKYVTIAYIAMQVKFIICLIVNGLKMLMYSR